MKENLVHVMYILQKTIKKTLLHLTSNVHICKLLSALGLTRRYDSYSPAVFMDKLYISP